MEEKIVGPEPAEAAGAVVETVGPAPADAAVALLSARQAVWALLARMWDAPLDEAAGAVLASPAWEAVVPLFGEEAAERFDAMARAASELGIERCEAAFNWCFLGIGTKVAPWESVYVTGERLIMQPSTLNVREAYAKAGFAARRKGSEPDDHIATECDFMAKLAERALAAWGPGEAGGAAGDEGAGEAAGEAASSGAANPATVCAEALAASRDFLAAHLLPHADDFADAFEEAAAKEGPSRAAVAADARALYGALARFAAAFYRADAEALVELIGAMAEVPQEAL